MKEVPDSNRTTASQGGPFGGSHEATQTIFSFYTHDKEEERSATEKEEKRKGGQGEEKGGVQWQGRTAQ